MTYWRTVIWLFLFVFTGWLFAADIDAQTPRSNRLGVTFISSAQTPPDDSRYQNALSLGAGWNRWPLYWNAVQPAPGQWNFSAYDRLVADDVRFGLNINAILLDKPIFYSDGAIISGLYEPVFADGTDIAAPNKPLNPNNPWAIFVYTAVDRYKPNGVFARQQGWNSGQGIRIWEMWNEPDLPQFWRGSINDYARLLKVGWLAAHQADPQAEVMVGGLLYNTPTNWLQAILQIYANDANRSQYNWYMDAVGVHSYVYPWRTGWLTTVTRRTLSSYNLNRPIYVNETGLNVWNDYPGPVWASNGPERISRGTIQQQAWFFVQSTAYAWAEGANVVFFHQLYDDCGDTGGNFPAHNGELCTGGRQCFGDGFGIFRNTRASACYSQHPNAGSARPVADAYRMMAQVFSQPFTGGREVRSNGYTMISFDRPNSGEVIRVLWNRQFNPNTAIISTSNPSATLYTLQGSRTITAENGAYNIQLRAAVPDRFPDLEAGDISAVGGEPVIIVERSTGAPPNIASAGDTSTSAIRDGEAGNTQFTNPNRNSGIVTPIPSSDQLIPTPGSILLVPDFTPPPDTSPPVTTMDALPAISEPTFIVRWRARDASAISRYVVWVRVNGGEWMPWIESQRTEGVYTGTSGNTYDFAVWAEDTAGNWSQNTDLIPQMTTQVQ